MDVAAAFWYLPVACCPHKSNQPTDTGRGQGVRLRQHPRTKVIVGICNFRTNGYAMGIRIHRLVDLRNPAFEYAPVEADEQYRSTVLTAFQNVADRLHALKQDADGLKAAAAARDAAKVTLDLTTRQMQVGYVSYLTLLNAEQIYQQSLINLVQAQSNRYADTAALFQALGGR